MKLKIFVGILILSLIGLGIVIVGCDAIGPEATTTTVRATTTTTTAATTTTTGPGTSTTSTTTTTGSSTTTTTTSTTTTTGVFSVSGTISGLDPGNLRVILWSTGEWGWNTVFIDEVVASDSFSYIITPESWMLDPVPPFFFVSAFLHAGSPYEGVQTGDRGGEYGDNKISSITNSGYGFWTNPGEAPAPINYQEGPVTDKDFSLSSTYEPPVISGTISGLVDGFLAIGLWGSSEYGWSPVIFTSESISGTGSFAYSFSPSAYHPSYIIGAFLKQGGQEGPMQSGDLGGEYGDNRYSSAVGGNAFWTNYPGTPEIIVLNAGDHLTGKDFSLGSTFMPPVISGTISGLIDGTLQVNIFGSSEGYWGQLNGMTEDISGTTEASYSIFPSYPTGYSNYYIVSAMLWTGGQYNQVPGDRGGEYSDGIYSEVFNYGDPSWTNQPGTPEPIAANPGDHLTGKDFSLLSTYEP